VHVGLKKGEAKHSLTRAVPFNRLGEIRDRSFKNQLYRASGLNLVVGAITLCNTVYLGKAIDHLKKTDAIFESQRAPPRKNHLKYLG
jgi:TnpA family transposase